MVVSSFSQISLIFLSLKLARIYNRNFLGGAKMGRTTEGVSKKGEEGQGDEEKRIFPFFLPFLPSLFFRTCSTFVFSCAFAPSETQGQLVGAGGNKSEKFEVSKDYSKTSTDAVSMFFPIYFLPPQLTATGPEDGFWK